MAESINRRAFLAVTTAAGLSACLPKTGTAAVIDDQKEPSDKAPRPGKTFLTKADAFVDVSRGNPKPSTLKGDALIQAQLTPETWRLEIVGDESSRIDRSLRREDGTALDFASLLELGKTHGVKYLKAMQCNNIPGPLGHGLWEGVPLRDLLNLVGKVADVRRVYYWGFHNNDPAQMFQSSLCYNRVMETPPWEPPPLVAYRLNGEAIPLERGGPVRMVIPWAHGFKSIKWLQRIVLTNDYKANDTYALQNNDPESYLKTAAYQPKGELAFKRGEPIVAEGTAMVGWSGLDRVEYWLRPGDGTANLPLDDPSWKSAKWRPCELMPPPDDWNAILPHPTSPKEIWGFDRTTGKPRTWPLLFSMVPWTARIEGLPPGSYELRTRTVDLNGFAQPEPRPYQKSGMNLIACRTIVVSA